MEMMQLRQTLSFGLRRQSTNQSGLTSAGLCSEVKVPDDSLQHVMWLIIPVLKTLVRPNPNFVKRDMPAPSACGGAAGYDRTALLHTSNRIGNSTFTPTTREHLGRTDMQPQPRSAKTVWALQRTKASPEVHARARAQALMRALTSARAQALARAQTLAPSHLQVALAQVEERQAVERMQAVALAQAVAGAQAEARAEARARAGTSVLDPMAYTYDEVLADSRLKNIIDSINDHHHVLAYDLRHSQEYWWLIQIIVPITRLPSELLHQIFLIIINEASGSPLVLMQVCKYWYTIITGIWASLTLGTRTPKDAVTRKLERNQALVDVLVDTEIDRGAFIPPKGAYEAIFTAIEASSRWRSFIVETFPAQADLPEHLVNHGLQRSSGTIMSRLKTFKIKSACETSPLLDHLLRILGTTASEELTTVEIKSANVISFLVPTHSSIFHSVKVLTLVTPGIPNPVDLLPHLHQLETLTASHLPLPVYHNDVNVPFIHTLRHLTLRSASIQWMSGRTFPILESCTLLFPLHRHVLHTFRTTLPNCKHLTFEGYPLEILGGISASSISHLSVTSSCSNIPRGNRQLARLSSRALRASRLAPQILHISIEATNQAWIKSFASMSNLVELVIDNAQPSSLGAKVLQSLVVHPIRPTNLDTTVTPGERNTPVFPSLKRFELRYRRWLRPSEHFDLIPDLVSIIWSRQQSKFSLQSFRIITRSDQQDPLELLDGSQVSCKGFERLANDCAIERRDLFQLMGSGLVEKMGVGQAEVSEFLRVSGFTPPPTPTPPPPKKLPPPPPRSSPPNTIPPRPPSPHKETADSPAFPKSMGKRARTPPAEYLRRDGGGPGRPHSEYYSMSDNAAFDDDLDFNIHDIDFHTNDLDLDFHIHGLDLDSYIHSHNPERDGLENVRVLRDGAVDVDVGTLSGSRHHHHNHDHSVSMSLPIARSQPGAAGSSSRPPPLEQEQQQWPSRPAFRSGWSFRFGNSNRGASPREDGTGGGSGVFSWFKRSRKEFAPVR
jgi:hypothetical protein